MYEGEKKKTRERERLIFVSTMSEAVI